jgi:hypothetical protein
MAPRRKATTNETTVAEHNCNQQKCIGEITARLDDQEKTDVRIETAVLNLVHETTQERANNADNFEKVRIELAKISTVMEATCKNTEQQTINQTKMLEQLVRLSAHTSAIKEQQDEFKKTIEKHIEDSETWKKDIEKRLNKLERFKYLWYILGVGVIAVLSAAAYLVTVLDYVNDRDVQTVQVAPSPNK